jgi:acetyl esterase/lipase
MKSIIDSQNAYQWILENGPDGPQNCDLLIVAGDSAGGNLALMLSNWSKDGAARRPDGVIGFSPSTDMTLSSPTIRRNRETDKLLGEGLGLLTKLPTALQMWVGLFSMRINPSNKLASPVFDNLSDLPPTLIHASSSEMLLGDCIRYTNKAIAAGSLVKLQIWKNQMHDWHLFNMHSGSAKEAWTEVKKFIDNL